MRGGGSKAVWNFSENSSDSATLLLAKYFESDSPSIFRDFYESLKSLHKMFKLWIPYFWRWLENRWSQRLINRSPHMLLQYIGKEVMENDFFQCKKDVSVINAQSAQFDFHKKNEQLLLAIIFVIPEKLVHKYRYIRLIDIST